MLQQIKLKIIKMIINKVKLLRTRRKRDTGIIQRVKCLKYSDKLHFKQAY